MPDYEAMYFELFNEITEVIARLIAIQQKLEDEFVEAEES